MLCSRSPSPRSGGRTNELGLPCQRDREKQAVDAGLKAARWHRMQLLPRLPPDPSLFHLHHTQRHGGFFRDPPLSLGRGQAAETGVRCGLRFSPKHVQSSYCYFKLLVFGGFPGGANDKEPACQYRRHKRRRFDAWVGKIPLQEGVAIHSSIPASRILWTEEPERLYSPRGRKESNTTEVI